jgi:hypothetical protein
LDINGRILTSAATADIRRLGGLPVESEKSSVKVLRNFQKVPVGCDFRKLCREERTDLCHKYLERIK